MFCICFGFKNQLVQKFVGRSEVFGTSVEVTLPLANLLHCKVGKLPMTCLGVPIGAKSRSKAVWRRVVDNFE